MTISDQYKNLYDLLGGAHEQQSVDTSNLRIHIWKRLSINQISDIVTDLPDGGCFAVIYNFNKSSSIVNLLDIMALPFHLRRIKKALIDAHITIKGQYGIYPNYKNPFLVYQLKSTASNYTEDNIIPDVPSGILKIIYKILSKIFGCYPTVGCILVIGEKL